MRTSPPKPPRQAAAVLPPFPPCHGQRRLRSEDVDAGRYSSGGAGVQRAGRRNDEEAATGDGTGTMLNERNFPQLRASSDIPPPARHVPPTYKHKKTHEINSRVKRKQTW